MSAKGSPESFYNKAISFWKTKASTIDDMLGGLGHLSGKDIATSTQFLYPYFSPLRDHPNSLTRALDCGAGIGRVTKCLLIPMFDEVDMVEQSSSFLEKAPRFLGDDISNVKNLFCSGLQTFIPTEDRYDLIVCQWVLAYLTDDDLLLFFKRCINALKRPSGLIFVKENVTWTNDSEVDEEDSSVTRPECSFKQIFSQSGLKILSESVQRDFPEELYPVKMYILQPVVFLS